MLVIAKAALQASRISSHFAMFVQMQRFDTSRDPLAFMGIRAVSQGLPGNP